MVSARTKSPLFASLFCTLPYSIFFRVLSFLDSDKDRFLLQTYFIAALRCHSPNLSFFPHAFWQNVLPYVRMIEHNTLNNAINSSKNDSLLSFVLELGFSNSSQTSVPNDPYLHFTESWNRHLSFSVCSRCRIDVPFLFHHIDVVMENPILHSLCLHCSNFYFPTITHTFRYNLPSLFLLTLRAKISPKIKTLVDKIAKFDKQKTMLLIQVGAFYNHFSKFQSQFQSHLSHTPFVVNVTQLFTIDMYPDTFVETPIFHELLHFVYFNFHPALTPSSAFNKTNIKPQLQKLIHFTSSSSVYTNEAKLNNIKSIVFDVALKFYTFLVIKQIEDTLQLLSQTKDKLFQSANFFDSCFKHLCLSKYCSLCHNSKDVVWFESWVTILPDLPFFCKECAIRVFSDRIIPTSQAKKTNVLNHTSLRDIYKVPRITFGNTKYCLVQPVPLLISDHLFVSQQNENTSKRTLNTLNLNEFFKDDFTLSTFIGNKCPPQETTHSSIEKHTKVLRNTGSLRSPSKRRK